MNTKALLLGTVASLALALPANATTVRGWYIGLEAGGNWIDDRDVDVDAGLFVGDATFATGWAGLGTLGYAWKDFRAELELGYRGNDIDTYFGGEGPAYSDAGEFNEFSQMANVVYDWHPGGGWSLFLGAGAGGDYILYKNDAHDGGGVALHDTDWVFAWQALGGVNFHLTKNTDLFIAYRYFNAQSPEFTELDGIVHSDAYDDVVKHTATVGLRYAFANAEPTQIYVAPPAPPPPPPPTLPPREFIVFFGHNKSNLVPEAMKVVKEAAAAAKQHGSANIRVVGHADRSGSAKYNDALSLKRANVVKGALAAEGIPDAAIAVSSKGESEPLVPTADGIREPQNRRVNISM